MGFDSAFFIGCFLPAVMLLYWLIPGIRGKNGILLIFGLVFYSFAGIPQLIMLVILSLLNYFIGRSIGKNRAKKPALILGICLNLTFLCVFKYVNFFFTQVFSLPAVNLGIAVPLGISFFTFKSISYLIDIYRKPGGTARSFGEYLLYVTYFPQIVTGPIARFGEFSAQLQARTHSAEAAAAGIRRFVVGLAKKLIISGTLGKLVDGVFGNAGEVLDARLAWLGAIGYCLQLYFDFSGYIDMANGLSGIFGFSSTENFNHPYTAYCIGDFWRRWHISLSAWFRDYVYIPLGGNRKGTLRTGLNKCVVFLLCGMWHGASWTFLLWGIWHGAFSLLESGGIIPVEKLKKRPLVGRLYTLLVVCIGFVIFRANSLGQGFAMLVAMFSGFTFLPAATAALHQLVNGKVVAVALIAILLCLPVRGKLSKLPWLRNHWDITANVGCAVLFVLSIMSLASGGFAPSIYAGF